MKKTFASFVVGGLALSAFTASAQALPVVTYNFNTDGNTEGFAAAAQITNLTAAGGLLTGDASGNDPQLNQNTPLTRAGTDFTTFIARVRQVDASNAPLAFSKSGLVLVLDPPVGVAGTQVITAEAAFVTTDGGDGFSLVTVDISGVPDAVSTLRSFRFDPVGNAPTKGFEIDFIQINDNSVPEPTTLAALTLGTLALGRRRRA